jgi:hypothetical protein
MSHASSFDSFLQYIVIRFEHFQFKLNSIAYIAVLKSSHGKMEISELAIYCAMNLEPSTVAGWM